MLASQRLDRIQLAAIDGIRRRSTDFTSSHIRDLVAAVIKSCIGQADILRRISGRILDSHTTIVDGRIAHRDRAIVTQIEVLVQFDQQLTVFAVLARDDTDVAIREVGFFLGIAFDIDLLVQFDCRGVAKVTTEFQAIIEGSGFMFLAARVFIDDTGHGFPILAIEARRTRFRPDIRHTVFAVQADMAFGSIDAIFAVDAFDGDAIVPVFTFDGDTILAVNADTRFTILAVDADMAILAVFAANAQLIAQFQVIRLLPIVVLDFQFQVFTSIVCCPGSGPAFNGDLGMLASQILYFLQLGHVDSIGIERTCSHAGNLTGDLAIVTYGNGVIRGFPGRTSRIPLNIDRLFFLIS